MFYWDVKFVQVGPTNPNEVLRLEVTYFSELYGSLTKDIGVNTVVEFSGFYSDYINDDYMSIVKKVVATIRGGSTIICEFVTGESDKKHTENVKFLLDDTGTTTKTIEFDCSNIILCDVVINYNPNITASDQSKLFGRGKW